MPPGPGGPAGAGAAYAARRAVSFVLALLAVLNAAGCAALAVGGDVTAAFSFVVGAVVSGLLAWASWRAARWARESPDRNRAHPSHPAASSRDPDRYAPETPPAVHRGLTAEDGAPRRW